MDLRLIERVGVGAAFKSAEILRSYFGNINEISKKGEIDLLTKADIASEKIIIETIREKFPDHAILAEESGFNEGKTEC
ncbi:MAG: inositol monophosphatase, partial [Desulfobacterales bacterium]|nr:inositol monophosphatase [Desulfobacterales bacterium]